MKEEEFTGYIPEQWVMLKDDIYAAQLAIRIGLEYNKDAIKTYEASLFDQDGPTRPNQKYLDILKNEKLILEQALEGLSKPYTDGEDLQSKQAVAKAKREKEQKIKDLEWRIDMVLKHIKLSDREKIEVENMIKELEKLREE